MKLAVGYSIVLLTIFWSACCSGAPSNSDKESPSLELEMNQIGQRQTDQKDSKLVSGHGQRHHHNHRVTLSQSSLRGMQEVARGRDALSKDTYMLLRSLKKVQGHDGRSPVCKICATNFVDAKTYDHFCLPDSETMDGDVCDRLTILGTTTARQISLACKLIVSRRPIICK